MGTDEHATAALLAGRLSIVRATCPSHFGQAAARVLPRYRMRRARPASSPGP